MTKEDNEADEDVNLSSQRGRFRNPTKWYFSIYLTWQYKLDKPETLVVYSETGHFLYLDDFFLPIRILLDLSSFTKVIVLISRQPE